MTSIDDLRHRHALDPGDAAVADALAEALRRRGEPVAAREVLQRCLTHDRAATSAEPTHGHMLRELVSLPAPSPPSWRCVRRVPLAELLDVERTNPWLAPRTPKIVGSCLLTGDWTGEAFGGRALASGAAGHPLAVIVVLTDGAVLQIDLASLEVAELFRPSGASRRARSHGVELRQFDVRVDASHQSVAYRDPPGPFVALWPGRTGEPDSIDGRTCVAAARGADHIRSRWLLGGLRGDIVVLSPSSEGFSVRRWSLHRQDPIWAIGSGEDGSVTTIHDFTGLEVRAAVDSDVVVHRLEDAALMHGRARVSIDGARAGSVQLDGRQSTGSGLLRVYDWRTSRWTEVELEQFGGWSSDASMHHAVVWDRHGALEWLDLRAATRHELAARERPPMRVWPAADGRFAVVVDTEQIEVLA